jgi:hypothetical protein
MTSGFHEGELAVQRRAGVADEASRLAGMLDDPDLDGGIGGFLAERDVAVLTARDADGRLWISPLVAAPGFLNAHGSRLHVHASPAEGDPLHALPGGQRVGLLAIEFARRRRVRVNGTLTGAGDDGLTIAVEQAYGNCPKYIQQRRLERTAREGPRTVRRSSALDPADIALIEAADTFFLGTVHPARGADASHRGGTPGFLRVVDGGALWWPDYPGNNMFNSLGNLASDDTAALLVVDFGTGATLHLSGAATVEWTASGEPGDDGGTGRRVRFTPDRVVSGSVALHAGDVARYGRNPPLT